MKWETIPTNVTPFVFSHFSYHPIPIYFFDFPQAVQIESDSNAKQIEKWSGPGGLPPLPSPPPLTEKCIDVM